jgi:DNA-binding transcriptional regulator YhcF (GntR family)
VLAIDRAKRGSLVDQIVAAIAQMVNQRELRVGTKMPSVRQFTKCNGVITFTVVET